jgi:hypothetical protein
MYEKKEKSCHSTSHASHTFSLYNFILFFRETLRSYYGTAPTENLEEKGFFFVSYAFKGLVTSHFYDEHWQLKNDSVARPRTIFPFHKTYSTTSRDTFIEMSKKNKEVE